VQSPPQHGALLGAAWTIMLTAAKSRAIRLATAAAFGASLLIGTGMGSASEAATRPRHQPTADSRPHQNPHHVSPRLEARRPTRSAARPTAARPTAVQKALSMASRRAGTGTTAPLPREANPALVPFVSPNVLLALRSAAGARRDDRVLLFALAWRESRCDPDGRNPASTARGLMQFTRATWLEAVRDHGAAHGLASQAAALATDRETGDITARDRRLLAELLVLRDDPRLSAALAMARLERERASLARDLRRPVTHADLYMVHFIGPEGARRFLRDLARAPSGRASDAVGPEAVAANRNVFVASDGRHLSLREVYARSEAPCGRSTRSTRGCSNGWTAQSQSASSWPPRAEARRARAAVLLWPADFRSILRSPPPPPLVSLRTGTM
jgi:Transglycosylase SLT domain